MGSPGQSWLHGEPCSKKTRTRCVINSVLGHLCITGGALNLTSITTKRNKIIAETRLFILGKYNKSHLWEKSLYLTTQDQSHPEPQKLLGPHDRLGRAGVKDTQHSRECVCVSLPLELGWISGIQPSAADRGIIFWTFLSLVSGQGFIFSTRA